MHISRRARLFWLFWLLAIPQPYSRAAAVFGIYHPSAAAFAETSPAPADLSCTARFGDSPTSGPPTMKSTNSSDPALVQILPAGRIMARLAKPK